MTDAGFEMSNQAVAASAGCSVMSPPGVFHPSDDIPVALLSPRTLLSSTRPSSTWTQKPIDPTLPSMVLYEI